MITTEIIGYYLSLIFIAALVVHFKDKRKLKNCKHKNTYIKVVQTVVTCETTVEVCMDCDKVLTEPKTDCR